MNLYGSTISDAVQDSLLSVCKHVLDDASRNSDSGFIKLLIVICFILIIFVGWLVVVLVKANIGKSAIISSGNASCSDGKCNSHDDTISLLNDIKARMSDIDNSIDRLSLWMQKKDSEDTSREQRLRIMRSKVMSVLNMFYDKNMRAFVVAKSSMFIDFVLENIDIIKQEDGYNLFEQIFKNKAEEAFSLAAEILGCKKAKEFYEDNHNKSVDEYLVNTKKIYEDETNDKINRLFNLSILFMQEFISQLNKIQDKEVSVDSFIEDDNSDVAREFKKLEAEFRERKERTRNA